MLDLFGALDRESSRLGEEKDCAVKAVAIVCGREKDYKGVLQLFKQNGRQYRGKTKNRTTKKVIKALGCEMVDVTGHFSSKTIRTLEREMRGVEGRYLISVRAHLLSIVDGQVHDWSRGRCHRIKKIYKIVDNFLVHKNPDSKAVLIESLGGRREMRREDCEIGMEVMFGRTHGEKTRGKIVKLNSKKAKIEILEDRGRRSKLGTIWGVPYHMIEAADHSLPAVEAIVYSPFQPGVDQHILSAILCCYSGLSPENLHCDGERPISQVRVIHLKLKKQLRHLLQAYGREVNEEEIYDWDKARREHEKK